jgi:hypothetical protein
MKGKTVLAIFMLLLGLLVGAAGCASSSSSSGSKPAVDDDNDDSSPDDDDDDNDTTDDDDDNDDDNDDSSPDDDDDDNDNDTTDDDDDDTTDDDDDASPVDDDDDTSPAPDDDDTAAPSWTSVWTHGNAEFLGIWGSDPTNVIVVGGSVDNSGYPKAGDNIWFFSNGAYADKFRSSSDPVVYQGVWGTDASDSWAVGAQYTPGAWTSTDTIIATPATGGALSWSDTIVLYGVAGVSGDVFAVGYDIVNGVSAMWNYTGGSWSAMTNDSGMNPLLAGVWAADSSAVWAVGFNSGPVGELLLWNGASWAEKDQSADTEAWHTVWGTSVSDVFFAGAWIDGATMEPIIWRYDGSTYAHINPSGATGDLNGSWGTSDTNVFFVGQDNSGAAMILNYDGSTASPMTLPGGLANTALQAVWGSSPSDVYAVGYDTSNYTGVVLHYGS